jgi:hypothetical protein
MEGMQTLWQDRCSLQYTPGTLLSQRMILWKDLRPFQREKPEQRQTADKTF